MVDRVIGVFEDDALPFRIGFHVGIGGPADDQLERTVEGAQGLGHFIGQAAVFLGGLVADLPGAVHLVAQTPVSDPERLRAAVGLTQIAPEAAGRSIDVFDEIARFVEAARSEVDRQHHLRADGLAPLRELVHADRVRFRSVPGEVEPGRAPIARADAVLPIVGGNEISAGVAHDRDPEVADQLRDVAAHAVHVGAGMAGFVNAGVDRSAEMFQKGAVDTVVDRRDPVILVRDDRRFHVSSPLSNTAFISDFRIQRSRFSSSRSSLPYLPQPPANRNSGFAGAAFRPETSDFLGPRPTADIEKACILSGQAIRSPTGRAEINITLSDRERLAPSPFPANIRPQGFPRRMSRARSENARAARKKARLGRSTREEST